MLQKRYKCIVCGRVFPEGQGIVITRANITLTFHSKACLTKFFKVFIEYLNEECYKKTVKQVLRDFEEALKLREKAKQI